MSSGYLELIIARVNIGRKTSNFWVITEPSDALVPSSICTSIRAIVIKSRARFLSHARSKLRLCSANHRPGYLSNLPCDWPSTAWAYSEQETENRPRSLCTQIAKALGSMSVRCRSDMKVSDRCLIFVDPRVFAIWVYGATWRIIGNQVQFHHIFPLPEKSRVKLIASLHGLSDKVSNWLTGLPP